MKIRIPLPDDMLYDEARDAIDLAFPEGNPPEAIKQREIVKRMFHDWEFTLQIDTTLESVTIIRKRT